MKSLNFLKNNRKFNQALGTLSLGANLDKIMYLGKNKLNNPAQYERDRDRNLEVKSSAVWVTFFELDGLINKSALARQYFGRSQGWLSQKLNGCTSHNVRQRFSAEEYHELAEAFRDIARRLNAHADEIDAAAMDPADTDSL